MEGLATLTGTVTLATAVCVALVIDRLFGEPPAWAHPVVAMGRYLDWFGPRLWRLPRSQRAWVAHRMVLGGRAGVGSRARARHRGDCSDRRD